MSCDILLKFAFPIMESKERSSVGLTWLFTYPKKLMKFKTQKEARGNWKVSIAKVSFICLCFLLIFPWLVISLKVESPNLKHNCRIDL